MIYQYCEAKTNQAFCVKNLLNSCLERFQFARLSIHSDLNIGRHIDLKVYRLRRLRLRILSTTNL